MAVVTPYVELTDSQCKRRHEIAQTNYDTAANTNNGQNINKTTKYLRIKRSICLLFATAVVITDS